MASKPIEMASLFNKPALLQNFFLNKFNVRLHQVKAQTNDLGGDSSNSNSNNAEGDDQGNNNENDVPPPPAPASSSQDDMPPPPLRKETVDIQNDSQVANSMAGTGKKIFVSGFTKGYI